MFGKALLSEPPKGFDQNAAECVELCGVYEKLVLGLTLSALYFKSVRLFRIK